MEKENKQLCISMRLTLYTPVNEEYSLLFNTHGRNSNILNPSKIFFSYICQYINRNA